MPMRAVFVLLLGLAPAAAMAPAVARLDIRMEVWLPLSGWNSQFRGTSPDGLGGVINYNAMSVGVTDGFAVGRY